MNLVDMMVNKARHRRTNTTWFHLYEEPKVIKFAETKSRIVFARGWSKYLMGIEFQFWKMKNVPEIDNGGYTHNVCFAKIFKIII